MTERVKPKPGDTRMCMHRTLTCTRVVREPASLKSRGMLTWVYHTQSDMGDYEFRMNEAQWNNCHRGSGT
jgi:hypothetical protein